MEGSGEEERRRTRVKNSHVPFPPTSRRAATPTLPTDTLLHKQDFPQTDAGDQGSQLKSSRGQAHTQVRGARLSNTPGSSEDCGRKPGPRASAPADRSHVE